MKLIVFVLFLNPIIMAMQDLTTYKWNNRLIAVSEVNTQAIDYFNNLKTKNSSAWSERKLKLVTLPSDQFLNTYDKNTFAALVGLDGGTKAVYKTPPDIKLIFQTIDAMPMRQQELRK